MIIVIIKNKLMSVDSVLPVLLEIKQKYDISSLIVVSDEMAHEGIRKNVVIKDVINYVGKELYIGSKKTNKVIRKIVKVGWLFVLIIRLLFGVKVVHFGVFEENVILRIIGRLFSNNIFLFQSDSYFHSYSKFDKILCKKPVHKLPVGRNIVAFNSSMPQLSMVDEYYNVFKFGSTRTRKSWINYIKDKSEYYFDKYHDTADLSNGCIVFILAFFGEIRQMREPNESLKILLSNTIETLDIVRGRVPVMIKPHVFTDLGIVNTAVSGRDGYHITYLHPSVLATKAKVFICNTYSTTMADAKSMGVKTVEYSDYSKLILKASNGNSVGHEYIDVFINNDQDRFETELRSILSTVNESSLSESCTLNDENVVNSDDEKLLFSLSK